MALTAMFNESLEISRPDLEPRAKYPFGLIEVWRAQTGALFTLRPVMPQDQRALGEMYGRLSRTTSYNRFHGAMSVPPELLYAMAHVDHHEHLGLVVTITQAGREVIVADARYVADADGAAAEFAIVVEDRWQRLGLATRLIGALVRAARERGLGRLYGSVLRENLSMAALMQRCGFAGRFDYRDGRLTWFEMRLSERGADRARLRERPADHRNSLDNDFAAWFGDEVSAG